jgi:uncharacterized protein (TIGR03382 family)
MKLAAASLLVSLATLAEPGVADACGPPAPTCGDEFCTGPVGVMEATIASSPTTENYQASIVIHVIHGWGMTDGIPEGSDRTLKTSAIFSGEDIGKTYVLYLERDGDGDLTIQRRVDLTEYYSTMCFGADVTAESIATIALETDCYHMLTPFEPDPGHCPDANGCNAGGAVGGGPLALLLAGLVVGRRRRQKK